MTTLSRKNQEKNNLERRTFVIDGFKIETRGEGDDEMKTIVGHAAVFNEVDGGEWFKEKILPGAFAESIGQDDIRALFNHNPDFVLGRNKAGTLKLSEDDTGLVMEITPPDTTVARDLLESISRGDISQASFAFRTLDDSWETVDGEEVRTLKRVQLFDVSPVTYPFYEATDVALRTKEERENQKKSKSKMNIRRKRFDLQHR